MSDQVQPMGEADGAKPIEAKPMPTKRADILVPINKEGIFEFSNQQELAAGAKMLIQLSIAPDHLKKAGFEAVAAAMVFVKQRRLPQTAMNQCAFVKGKLTQYGSLVTALAEQHTEYGLKREFFVDGDSLEICTKNKNLKSDVYAAVVQVKKKGSDVWNEYFFSVDDAKQAGLLTEKTSADSGWTKYLKDMLFHKANARALRAQYASALEGVNYHEDHVERWDMKDVTPPSTRSAALNSAFSREARGVN
jgi:hypothetical protein